MPVPTEIRLDRAARVLHVTFDDGGKAGKFYFAGLEQNTLSVDGSGNCTIIYRPGANDVGLTTLSATYTDGSKTYEYLAVELRPTQTTVAFGVTDGVYVNEQTNLIVTVTDIGGSASVSGPSKPLPRNSTTKR